MPRPFGIRLDGVSKSFDAGSGERVNALQNVSVAIEPGEFVIVVGHNGSGKSTMLNLVAGTYGPDSGEVGIWSENDGRPSAPDQAGAIARVYQDPDRGTFPELTVGDNLKIAAMRGAPSPISRSRQPATAPGGWLAEAGLRTKIDQRVQDLSQGQRQMLAMELAVIRNPSILLLDEHTASLDRINAAKCMQLTEHLCRSSSTTTLLITHNLTDSLTYGDRLLVLRDGELVANLVGAAKSKLDMAELLGLCGLG